MKVVSRTILACAVAAAAAGCTNLEGGSLGRTFTTESFLSESFGDSTYNQALASEYQRIAAFNANTDVNWLDATVYQTRAEQAAAGSPPALFSPAAYGVNGDLEALRAQTMAAVDANAASRPQVCAEMAASYDRLVEETYQPGGRMDAENVRAFYDDAYAACAGIGLGANEVYFAFDSAMIPAEMESVLNDIIAGLVDAASAISVVGHADAVGSEAYNIALSERRADSVIAQMTNAGIARDRIAKGFVGESEPVPGSNPTDAVNRRVVISAE